MVLPEDRIPEGQTSPPPPAPTPAEPPGPPPARTPAEPPGPPAEKAKSWWEKPKDLFGCCCLAPLICGLVLLALGTVGIILLQEQIAALGANLVNSLFDSLLERLSLQAFLD